MNQEPQPTVAEDQAMKLAERLVEAMQVLGIQNRDGSFTVTLRFKVEGDKVTNLQRKFQRNLEF